MNNHAWTSNATRTEKPWGYEVVWGALPQIHGKILNISKGMRTSLKYNVSKDEVLFVLEGELEVMYGDERSKTDPVDFPLKNKKMFPGDVLYIQPGSPYRLHAIEECRIVEIGNRNLGKPVRVQDDHGRNTEVESWARGL
jgi:mannose-6-phosphate isomerase-like protein (cupin superfamily)